MQIQFEISAEKIADLMVTAIEGNYMTRAWCNGVFIQGDWRKKYDETETHLTSPWYSNPEIYERFFILDIEEILDESKPAMGKNIKKHRCTQDNFKKAFKFMAEKYSWAFGSILTEDYDIVAADMFLQLVAMGEVKYG